MRLGFWPSGWVCDAPWPASHIVGDALAPRCKHKLLDWSPQQMKGNGHLTVLWLCMMHQVLAAYAWLFDWGIMRPTLHMHMMHAAHV